jgi:hypothetical protein
MPNALIVGENTSGDYATGGGAYYQMPNSRLELKIPVASKRDAALFAQEGIGFLPDIWIDPQSPLDLSKQIAKCLADKVCSSQIRNPLDSPDVK